MKYIAAAMSADSIEFLVPLLTAAPIQVVVAPPTDWGMFDRRALKYFRLPLPVSMSAWSVPSVEWHQLDLARPRRTMLDWVDRAESRLGDLGIEKHNCVGAREFFSEELPDTARGSDLEAYTEILAAVYSLLRVDVTRPAIFHAHVPLDGSLSCAVDTLRLLSEAGTTALRGRGHVRVIDPAGRLLSCSSIEIVGSQVVVVAESDESEVRLTYGASSSAGWRLHLTGSAKLAHLASQGPAAHAPWHSLFLVKGRENYAEGRGLSIECVSFVSCFWPRYVTSRSMAENIFRPGGMVWQVPGENLGSYAAAMLDSSKSGLSAEDIALLNQVVILAYGRRPRSRDRQLRRAIGGADELLAVLRHSELHNILPNLTLAPLRRLLESLSEAGALRARGSEQNSSTARRLRAEFARGAAEIVGQIWRLAQGPARATPWIYSLLEQEPPHGQAQPIPGILRYQARR